jgi:hypothetical protein
LSGIESEAWHYYFQANESRSSDHRSATTFSKSSVAVSSDRSLVDLLKQALIALSLLPENSSSGKVSGHSGVFSYFTPKMNFIDFIYVTSFYYRIGDINGWGHKCSGWSIFG